MEAKMRVLKNTNDKSIKTIISIPPCAASGVLKGLHKNKLCCDYMGLDQEGRILMEVTFEESHEVFMKEINEYIEECEGIADAFTKSFEELIKKRTNEIDQMLAEHKRKSEERKRKSSIILNYKNGSK